MMNIRNYNSCIPVILLLTLVAISVPGCSNGGGGGLDTCTQGDNMTSLQVDGVFNAAALAPELRIIWETGTEQGAKLPEAYFEEVVLADETNADVGALIDSVTYTNTQEITIVFADLAVYLKNENVLNFSLAFPDRVHFIDCTHPGMEDQYRLNMTLNFDTDGNYSDAEFTQFIIFGAI